ncbi:MAG TPA: DUF2059 domain-containing protein [Candidatus Dormibacteraeota bacterium]|nr:DUF2059 domain-containing protein [Candidatus Dormibacteraeota bacterium]
MKAVLALVVIYIGTFIVAIQGASQNPVQAADTPDLAQTKSIDPVKEADIRSLLELIGAHHQVSDAVLSAGEQYPEKLLATLPAGDRGPAFVSAFADRYQKNVDQDFVTRQVVNSYDRRFTEDEIRELLQFFGSPLGKKVVSESPKIAREMSAASRELSAKVARETLQTLKAQFPEPASSARLAPLNPLNNELQPRQAQNESQVQAQLPELQLP